MILDNGLLFWPSCIYRKVPGLAHILFYTIAYINHSIRRQFFAQCTYLTET